MAAGAQRRVGHRGHAVKHAAADLDPANRMNRVGVIGIGRMGFPIAQRWHERGQQVTVYDVSDARREAAASAGLTVAPDLPALAHEAEILVTVLPGSEAVEAAVAAALPVREPGSLWVDLSSADPEASARLSRLAEEAGVAVAAAPMAGNPARAEDGTLTFYLAGRPQPVATVTPLLELCGSVVSAGDVPAHAHAVKLLANLLWFGQAAAVTEAMLVGTGLGIDAELLRSLLASSAGGSAFIDQHLPALMAGDDMTDFGIDGCLAELEAVARLAEATSTPFELSGQVLALYRQAVDRFGPVPGELLAARLIEQRAGRKIGGD
jgi:3-hydroxyisobutyrate dehydrogenase